VAINSCRSIAGFIYNEGVSLVGDYLTKGRCGSNQLMSVGALSSNLVN